MSDVIIDTNVAVVANRQNSEVVTTCVDACIRFITEVRSNHVVLIDEAGEIRAEYAKALKVSRPLGLGALFLVDILQHSYDQKRVRRVDLKKKKTGDFVDFPETPELADFDQDDRKFVSLSRRTGAPVATAIDSDWVDKLAALKANDVSVRFLCGNEKNKWFTQKSRRRE